MNGGGNWKGSYGYDTKHSRSYFTDYHSRKTESGVGVGTGQLTYKRCGVARPNPAQAPMAANDTSSQQCTTGTCPWR